MINIKDNKGITFIEFSEVPVGIMFQRIGDNPNLLYVKYSTSNSGNNSILLNGTSTQSIPENETVVVPHIDITITYGG